MKVRNTLDLLTIVIYKYMKQSKIYTEAPMMQTQPKRGRGRPKGAGKPQNPYIDKEDGDYQTATDLKSQMTTKELKFLEIYMAGECTREKAMIAAGYNDLHPRYRYFLASKIIQKYETQAADHRIIARALGAGEVFVISGLMELAKNGKSEIVKRAALGDLAKILGLTKEQLETAGGITIIFEGQQPSSPAALALEPGEGQPALPAQPVRVLQITK